MRQLWRMTAGMFWQHPVLWMPVISADVASFVVSKLQSALTRALIRSVAPSLGFKTLAFTIPIVWGSYLLHLALYAMALVMTAVLVRTLQSADVTQFRPSLELVRLRWRGIAQLSLTGLGGLAIYAILFGTVISASHLRIHDSAVTYGCSATLFLIIAYCIAPMGMRLIRRSEQSPLDTDTKRTGRIFAVLTVLASSLIAYGLIFMERSILAEPLFQPAYIVFVLAIVASLLSAVPYVLLFIALTLLVDREVAPDAVLNPPWISYPTGIP